jgi:Family of unknown function (DUF5681)
MSEQERLENSNENSSKPFHQGTANLKPFPKGVSGNPKGRGHAPSIVTAMKRLLKEVATKDGVPIKEGYTWAEVCAKALLGHVVKGNGAAIKAVLDRTEGLIVSKSEVSGPDGGPIRIDNSGLTEEEQRRLDELIIKRGTRTPEAPGD